MSVWCEMLSSALATVVPQHWCKRADRVREKERANRQWQGIRPRSIEVQARGQERREREKEKENSLRILIGE